MQAIPIEEYQQCLRQQYLYGLNARSTANLIHAHTLQDMITICERYFKEMDLRGFFRVCVNDECHTKKFGLEKASTNYSRMAKIAEALTQDQKIIVTDEFLIINAEMLLLTVEVDDQVQSDVSIYQDLLVIFTDTLEGWLTNYGLKKLLSKNLNRSLQDIIQASQDLIEKYIAESDELLYGIIARFPTLGLEIDQEEMILDVIRDSSRRQLSLLENEIQRNSKFGDILIESVKALEDVKNKKSVTNIEEQNNASVDLF